VIIGFANIYTLAPMARLAPFWNIPLITTGGMTSEFDSKEKYRLITRVSGSYAPLAKMVVQLLSTPATLKSNGALDYYNQFWIIAQNAGQFPNERTSYPQSECFFAMTSIKREMTMRHQTTHDSRWASDNIVFKPFLEWHDETGMFLLRNVSFHANGQLLATLLATRVPSPCTLVVQILNVCATCIIPFARSFVRCRPQ
jgi:hypothetical protein